MSEERLPENCFTIGLPRPFGRLLVCYGNGKLRQVRLIGKIGGRAGEKPERSRSSMRDAELERRLRADFTAYFRGRKVDFNYAIDVERYTPFQKAVWAEMREIPYGETRSYRWIAEKVGKPRAYRAVGNACGKNPLLIIQPCHRVVGSHGKLGGFSGGLGLKKALLRLEGVSLAAGE
jgi:O-6-methylguanine DNA methyltransferase